MFTGIVSVQNMRVQCAGLPPCRTSAVAVHWLQVRQHRDNAPAWRLLGTVHAENDDDRQVNLLADAYLGNGPVASCCGAPRLEGAVKRIRARNITQSLGLCLLMSMLSFLLLLLACAGHRCTEQGAGCRPHQPGGAAVAGCQSHQ